MLEHGGRLREAAAHYAIPLADWLDLSTGINPNAWPVPALPATVWHRLPENGDGLEAAAQAYYGNPKLLPVAGSQAAIQWLPVLLPRAAVACIAPLYAEHPQAWQHAGHKIRFLQNATLPRALAAATPYVLLCNPNNPTADHHPHEMVVDAARQLKKRGGWLIVDEAFVDATPELSVTSLAGSEEAPNLIVLRSLGKFFGLAGARVGFIFGVPEKLDPIREMLGPWPVSHPSRAVARAALQDMAWQAGARHLGLADDYVGWALDKQNQDLLSPALRAKLEELRVDILTGKIQVHDYLQDGQCALKKPQQGALCPPQEQRQPGGLCKS